MTFVDSGIGPGLESASLWLRGQSPHYVDISLLLEEMSR
jgi:hypothetical protein